MGFTDLGDLADPTKYQDLINIQGRDPSVLRSQLYDMVSIRSVEEHLAAMRRDGMIGGPVHLGIGQEAIAVAVSQYLRPSDMVFGTHRSHTHILALGSSIRGLFAEVLGKVTGLSKGMGGSMHLWDGPRGFCGSVPIVGGTVPLAVGAGLASKLKGSDELGVCYLGDGAMEEGVVQESMNLAKVLGVPVLFVIENNLFSSHMHISLRQTSDSTARFAEAHNIPFEVVDGNNVAVVADAVGHLIDQARRGEGPGFLEAVTFRWLGHVDWREDVDVGVKRSAKTLAEWRARDPISRLERALIAAGQWSADQSEVIRSEIQQDIVDAWETAMADPWPENEALLDSVYAMRTDPSDG